MKKLFSFAAILIFTACKTHELSSLPENTQTLIKSCQVCHANVKNPNKGPNLDGMQKWYIIDQINNFKKGHRGKDGSASGTLMTAAAQAIPDNQIEEVADWFADQEIKKNKVSFNGNIETGKGKYEENCRGCHSSSIGRFFTGSPKIEQLEGVYVFDQLIKFRDGKRNFYNTDKHKEKMIVVAKRFNDQEFKDIVAYLESQK